MIRKDTIHETLYANASKRPDQNVLHWESNRLTWDDLASETSRFARIVSDSTETGGTLVGTWGSSAPLHIIALLAAGLAEYVHVPLNPRWPRSFLRSILPEVSLVIVDGRLPIPDEFHRIRHLTWSLAAAETDRQDMPGKSEIPDPHMPVAIDFTRGTFHSGPRGCYLTHDMILSNARSTSRAMNLEFPDTVAFLFPGWLHPHELIGKSLVTGNRSVVIDFPYPKTVLTALNRSPATCIITGPRVMESLLPFRDRLRDACKKVRSVILVGDYPSPLLVSSLETYAIPSIFNGWASAESSGVALIGEIDSRTTDKIGFPCPGYEVSIQSEATPREGQLLVKGPGVSYSYLDNTPVSGPEGWFKTGDMVRLLKDDSLRLMGRPGEAWTRAGKRVPLRQIESTLERVPGIYEVVAIPVSTEPGALSIIIEPGDETIPVSNLIRRLRQLFGSSELPDMRIVRSLPRLQDGRTDRSALKHGLVQGDDIETIDRRILHLINRRARLMHMESDDSRSSFSHDEAVIMQLLGHNTGPLYDDSVEEIFRSILDHCRRI